MSAERAAHVAERRRRLPAAKSYDGCNASYRTRGNIVDQHTLDTSRPEHLQSWCSRRPTRRQASAHISFRHAVPGRGGGDRCSHREQGPEGRKSRLAWSTRDRARIVDARCFPNPRVGNRQRACSSPGCQASRRHKTQAACRASKPEDFVARRIAARCFGGSIRHGAVTRSKSSQSVDDQRRSMGAPLHPARDGLSCQASARGERGAKKRWIRAGRREPRAAPDGTWG